VRIERLRAEHGVKVEWVHFPLHPDAPAEGRSLDDLFAGRNLDRKAMHAQMKARMDAEGLPYGERTMTYNSRLAQELGKWADTQPGGEPIHEALFRAYFVEARDISKPAVLLEIAERVGLPVEAAREVLERRTFEAAVDADWRPSHELGISGVPTFVAGRWGVVGAQPYEILVRLVERARTPAEGQGSPYPAHRSWQAEGEDRGPLVVDLAP
jgi:predicted DsbA family dithiol-disulfide isomerase